MPVGTRPGFMYENCKVHKQQVDGCPPFRPILSALQTPTYNLAKFLVPLLNPLTKNEYTVKDSFQFAEEICEQDPTLSMGSLDVDSLFTNIPLDETIDICINQLFENTDTVEGITNSELKQIICLATTCVILYLTVYFTNKLQQWGRLLDLPLLTHFCHTMKKTG